MYTSETGELRSDYFNASCCSSIIVVIIIIIGRQTTHPAVATTHRMDLSVANIVDSRKLTDLCTNRSGLAV